MAPGPRRAREGRARQAARPTSGGTRSCPPTRPREDRLPDAEARGRRCAASCGLLAAGRLVPGLLRRLRHARRGRPPPRPALRAVDESPDAIDVITRRLGTDTSGMKLYVCYRRPVAAPRASVQSRRPTRSRRRARAGDRLALGWRRCPTSLQPDPGPPPREGADRLDRRARARARRRHRDRRHGEDRRLGEGEPRVRRSPPGLPLAGIVLGFAPCDASPLCSSPSSDCSPSQPPARSRRSPVITTRPRPPRSARPTSTARAARRRCACWPSTTSTATSSRRPAPSAASRSARRRHHGRRPAAPSTSAPGSTARRENPNSMTVGAGDLIGASPLISGAVPRRADDRVAQRDGHGRLQRRQPRVRRGHHRAAAHAERRLPPGRRLPGRRPFAGAASTTWPPTSATTARRRRSSRPTWSSRSAA